MDNGGPAFPHFINSRQHSVDGYTFYQGIEEGMTLRDYFAAKAMNGLLANPDCNLLPLDEVVPAAYKIADAMLKQRAFQKGDNP